MTVPENIETRLHAAVHNQHTYRYLGGDLSDKTLIAFIAPSATGKSRLISEILDQSNGTDIGEVGTLTTRDARDNDPQNYRTNISHETMLEYVEKGALVNWSLFPTGHIYGSAPESFAATYTLMPLIPTSLPMLQKAGFKAVHIIYLTAAVEQWDNQLNDRRDDPKFNDRMNEAINSLRFAKENIDSLVILSNKSGDENARALANHIITSVQTDTPIQSDPAAVKQIDEMLEYAYEAYDGNI